MRKILTETKEKYKCKLLLTCSFFVCFIPSFAVWFIYYLLLSFAAADQEDDYAEPDLSKYATIDMSTLRNVRKMGMDYVLSMEALLHTTPGLELGYLPEKDALHMLSGVSHSLFCQ